MGRKSLLIILSVLILVSCEYILFCRASAEIDLQMALGYLNKARFVSDEIIVQKSLLYRNALRLLDRSSKLNTLDSRPWFEYANALIEIGEDAGLKDTLETEGIAGAEKKFIEAVLREPANAIYHQRLGAVYARLSEVHRAEREFDNAVFLDPQNVRLRLYLAQYFFSAGKTDLGVFHLNKAVALYKTLPHGPISNEVEAFVKSA